MIEKLTELLKHGSKKSFTRTLVIVMSFITPIVFHAIGLNADVIMMTLGIYGGIGGAHIFGETKVDVQREKKKEAA